MLSLDGDGLIEILAGNGADLALSVRGKGGGGNGGNGGSWRPLVDGAKGRVAPP